MSINFNAVQTPVVRPPAARFGQQTFGGETYDGSPVGTVWGNTGISTPVANREQDGVVYPLMVGLRPAQMQVLADISTKLDTLNTNLTTTLNQGFAQLAQAIERRFPSV